MSRPKSSLKMTSSGQPISNMCSRSQTRHRGRRHTHNTGGGRADRSPLSRRTRSASGLALSRRELLNVAELAVRWHFGPTP